MSDPPEEEEGSRTNGWNCPWHTLQIFAWILIVFIVILFFGVLAPSLISPWSYAVHGLGAALVVALVTTLVVATTLDPADPAVRSKGGNKSVPKFDRSKHKHVIENQSCALCQVIVGPKSKHCSACNKCVSGFDHHCRWLNNCVGERNYKWFFASLVFAILASLCVACVGITLFIGFFIDKSKGRIIQVFKDAAEERNQSPSLEMFGQPVADGIFLTFNILTVILALIAVAFLIHLTQFHIWLIFKGLSTYDFIIMQREKQRANEENSLKDMSSSAAKSQHLKGNKVTPSKQLSTEMTKSEEDLKHYQKALEDTDRIDGGETPPPLASPIREDQFAFSQNMKDESSQTFVRKMRRKKKKTKTSSQQEIQIATVEGQFASQNGSTHGAVSYRKMSHDSLGSSDPSGLSMSESPKKNNQRRRKSKLVDAAISNDPEEAEEDLNSTTMFSLNSSAQMNPDGSLKYVPGINSLPLTPIPKHRWSEAEQVPRLDLTVLRTSTDSSTSYKPYTGTSRSYDTIRFSADSKTLPPLRTLPEMPQDVRY